MSGNPLLDRFEALAPLAPADRAALLDLLQAWEWIPAGAVICREGDASRVVHAVLAGMACRCKDFRDGRRQIIALLLPGDLSRHPAGASQPPDHHLRALSRAKVARISALHLEAVTALHPRIARALQASAEIDAAVLRAWLVNLGQRPALERLAHLFCEIAHRAMCAEPSSPQGGFELPLTQRELGSALGLTSVHINRVLQRLRSDSLVDFASGLLRIHDLQRLERLAGFDSRYLSR